MAKIVLSVHGLVDFCLRSGDIDSRVFNIDTMTKGTQLHAYYQAKQNEKYLAEQYLEYEFVYGHHQIALQGRVDGIIVNNNSIIIEEIKTANIDLELFFAKHQNWHLGQAQCYALMYCLKFNREEIAIQLTYISQKDESKMIKSYTFTKDELIVTINSLFAMYFSLYERVEQYYEERRIGLEKLTFPFKNIRESQKIMMEEVRSSFEGNNTVYFNAPTGSGKTLAALYPSIEYLTKNPKTRIFYLTAKGSGKLQAENALKLLTKKLKLKSITLTSKEKMCVNDKIACNPDECEYAVDFFSNEKDAIHEAFTNFDSYTSENLLLTSTRHKVCPFEFQLDMSLFSDVIIADYNYLFDPFVYLQRFFDNKQGEYIVLVDEAHNLPRRVMDNYSKVLEFSPFYGFRKLIKGPLHKAIRPLINKIVRFLDEYSQGINPGYETINEFPHELLTLLEKFLVTGSEYMREVGEEAVEGFADFFFSVNKFVKILNLVDENFVIYTNIDEDKAFFPKFNIKCLNPQKFIKEALKGVEHTVFFSATLAPEPYFKTMLGMDKDIVHVPNPFSKSQLALLVDTSVSLYFNDRDKTMQEVINKIKAATSVKVGNYIVYVPSFFYLEKIREQFYFEDDVELIVQTASMTEKAKDDFINSFVLNPKKTTIGLAVLGGSFSEGVDLVSDRLSGVVVLGVGYPPPSFEKELEKEYYQRHINEGTNYAYVYPSLNKILQTMGRVIRSEEDRGFVLLMDKRYGHNIYKSEINRYNAMITKVTTEQSITETLAHFLFN